MIGTESNHYRIVADSIVGERQADEQTFASLAVLSERLERLKEQYDVFSGIKFSSAVKNLQSQKDKITVG